MKIILAVLITSRVAFAADAQMAERVRAELLRSWQAYE